MRIVNGSCSYDKCTNGSSFVGGIVGLARNAIFDKCVSGITVTSGRYSAAVGGICGYAGACTFNDCQNTGSLLAKCTFAGGYAACGGIAGMSPKNYGNNYNNCSNNGNLNTTTYTTSLGGTQSKGAMCGKTNGADFQY